ncbi:hypothetical protein V6N13_016893 [Hibiscus sabdariffa]
MLFIQESKLANFSLLEARKLWGDDDVEFMFSPANGKSGIVNGYAPNAKPNQVLLWEELAKLKTGVTKSWVASGDFNAVCSKSE